jgi:hypothetical protein
MSIKKLKPAIDPAFLKDPLRRYLFVKSINRVVDLETGQLVRREVFNAGGSGLAPCGAQGEKSAFAVLMNSGAKRTDDISYMPGTETIYFEGPLAVYNTWRPGMDNDYPFDVANDDIAPWLDHVNFILPDAVARGQFLNWCAFLIQKPGGKINWAYTLIGKQGCGKDLMLRPLYGILGRENYQAITAKDLEDNFTDWAERQLIIVEELPSFKKRDIYAWLKRYTAAGVPYFRVNKKNIAQYNVRNIQNWFIMSNHADALALEDDDRRYFIYSTPATRREPEYYKPLVALFDDAGFQAKVLAWLTARDISAFDPGECPPMTHAKAAMIAYARDPVDTAISEMFEPVGKFHGRELITPGEILTEALALRFDQIDEETFRKITPHRIGKRLARMGAVKLPGKHRVNGADRPAVYVWALVNHAHFERVVKEGTTDELRDLFQEDFERSRRSMSEEGKGDESRTTAEIVDFDRRRAAGGDASF